MPFLRNKKMSPKLYVLFILKSWIRQINFADNILFWIVVVLVAILLALLVIRCIWAIFNKKQTDSTDQTDSKDPISKDQIVV